MNENQNRRKDDARPAVALQWGDRPDQWTLLMTGPNAGVIGPLGSTWPEQPAEYERVDVCARRKDGPVGVFRTGGEGPTTWHQFYPLAVEGQQLRDGEYLYREGAAPKLDNIEQYRLQMAAIGTAALGYWKLGDSIHPDYDTVPLRDVAALFNKYDQLHRFREQVRGMVAMLKNREWAEDLALTGDAADLQNAITELIGQGPASIARKCGDCWDGMSAPDHVCESCGGSGKTDAGDLAPPAGLALPAVDAVDAAFTDAVTHGTGAFSVHADGSTTHVDLHQDPDAKAAANRAATEIVAFQMPPMVRDALYPDYAVPATEPKAP